MLQEQISKNDRKNIIAFSKIKHLPALYDGLFRVAKDGRIYRRNGSDYVLAAQIKTGRNGDHLLVSASVNGKQTQFHVRQLVAMAYIPNPDNKPYVLCKDGNGLNNHADNLIWATPKESTRLVAEAGKAHTKANAGVPCITCAEPTLSKSRICTRCRLSAKADERNAAREKAFRESVDKALTENDIGGISSRNIDIICQYAEGKTLQQIGDEYGITRERVRQIIFAYLKFGKNGNAITERQKQLATHIAEMGIPITRLSMVADVNYQNLGKMLKLNKYMPEDIFEKLCEITGYECEGRPEACNSTTALKNC